MLSNPKITTDHLAKKALVYVRQSTPKQVLHNQESQRLQYALVERARALGWHQIEVIDDDLGHSASAGTQRVGFKKLLATVRAGRCRDGLEHRGLTALTDRERLGPCMRNLSSV